VIESTAFGDNQVAGPAYPPESPLATRSGIVLAMSEQNVHAPGRKRSPGYPNIDLRTAVERTADLYDISRNQPIPLNAASKAWGYSEKSSSRLAIAAALKRFGLVRDVGNSAARALVLTPEAAQLVYLDRDERGSDRWRELVQAAALRPPIHRQVLDHFEGTLPDDRVAMHFLLFDVGFIDEDTARDFLKRFRATLMFAELDHLEDAPTRSEPAPAPPPKMMSSYGGSGTVWAVPESGPGERHAVERPPDPSTCDQFRGDRTAVQIPYSPGQWATLQASFPLSEAEWQALTSMLQALKPGLVQERPTARPPTEDNDEA
jgi:hypothetical protein